MTRFIWCTLGLPGPECDVVFHITLKHPKILARRVGRWLKGMSKIDDRVIRSKHTPVVKDDDM